jgi:hypothetical protein
MDESLVSKQDYAGAVQIVSNTSRKYNPTSTLQISIIFNSYGPIGGHLGRLVDMVTKISFSQWMNA